MSRVIGSGLLALGVCSLMLGCGGEAVSGRAAEQSSTASATKTGSSDADTANFTCGETVTGTASTPPTGFDLATGYTCAQGYVAPVSNGLNFVLSHSLGNHAGQNVTDSSFSVRASLLYSPGANSAAGATVGFNAAPAGTFNTDPTKHVLAGINRAGFFIDWEGTVTQLLGTGGDASERHAARGSMDSGQGDGWIAPPEGAYDVTLIYPGDGTLTVSFVSPGMVENSFSFRVPVGSLPTCASPCGLVGMNAALQNLEVSGSSSADRIGKIEYTISGPGQGMKLPNRSGLANGATLLRWWVSSNPEVTCAPGLESSACTNVFAWVPPGYEPEVSNKWVLAAHGYGETAQMIQMQYGPVSDALLNQGYILVSMDNSFQNCYGNAQCLADLTKVMSTVEGDLNLAAQPYLMGDSMGGLQMFNAVGAGLIKPRAIAGFCLATNLLWNYTIGGAAGPIDVAYGSTDLTYAARTSGFDPQLATGEAVTNMASVPILMFSSEGDGLVSKSQNSDLFAAKILSAGGSATVVPTAGNHEDPSNFNGAAVVDFFAKY